MKSIKIQLKTCCSYSGTCGNFENAVHTCVQCIFWASEVKSRKAETYAVSILAAEMDIWAEILREGTLACQVGAETEGASPVPVLSASDYIGGRTLKQRPTFPLIIIKEAH